jgi:hypothetical protein
LLDGGGLLSGEGFCPYPIHYIKDGHQIIPYHAFC